MQMRTFTAPADVDRAWYHVDASNVRLGRLASEIAKVLQGKHKPIYTRHVDTGDFVVVTQCENIQFTGDKANKKQYFWHTGYPGGIRSRTLSEMLTRCPERVLMLAVKRMLPRGPLGRAMIKKLKIYKGESHPHAAQQPVAWPVWNAHNESSKDQDGERA